MQDNQKDSLRLGVNIDHVATLRNARGGVYPDPVSAALLAQKAGADGITIHLREDRRHIRDKDATDIRQAIDIPLNFEMAATEEMVTFACDLRPNACCIVPEKREEVTTEGGLAVFGHEKRLEPLFSNIKQKDLRLSLFIEASEKEIQAAAALGADIIELHTGTYCHATPGAERQSELKRLVEGARLAHSLGLEVHAGHGLDFETVGDIAAIPEMRELNIGHFLISASVFTGLEEAISTMKMTMAKARAQANAAGKS
ncbi:MAG: pyridoxine 5'-phosphate synthase [Candidatus Puniceispirillaceae bacterium]